MPVGVYIQVPFCQTKCTYCNFHTGVVSQERYAPYARAVCREIAAWLAESKGDQCDGGVDTVYLGGGTPSLLEPATLGEIVSMFDTRLPPGAAPEITLEADPETITAAKVVAWRSAGLNRISLGAQSFNDHELRAAGRMHRRADIFQAARLLRDVGLCNISMDLIVGLPHQTRESWEDSVDQVLDIGPEHISMYMLELDDASRLGKESLAGGSRYGAGAIPSEDAMADFYESASARVAAEGYEHYEISNWARPGRRSRHNLKYWQRVPYIGFGAGAHSFDGQTRWANIHDAARYVDLVEQGISTREQIEHLTIGQALEEELFLGLRQMEGIDLARIERQYGAELQGGIEILRRRITELRSQGLLEIEGTRVRLAPDRLTISNEVFTALFD